MTRASCRGILLCWTALVGLSGWGQQFNDSAMIPDGDNWFDHPDILCTALQRLGYHARSWRQINGSPIHNCVYPPVVRATDTLAAIDAMLATAQPPPPLSLGFEISGLSAGQADSIRIAITIPIPEAKTKGKEQMLGCIDSLYRVIRQQVPAALPLYVQREEHYLSHQRYGTVSFLITSEPKEQVFWFLLKKNP